MQVLTIYLVALALSAGCTETDGAPTPIAGNTTPAPPQPPAQHKWRELCLDSHPSGPNSPLRFSLEYRSREVSKDSHGRFWSAGFDGRVLTVNGPYGKCTRGRCKHKEVAFAPTAEELTDLWNQLTRHSSLWDGVVEVDDTNFTVPYHTTTMTMELSDGQRMVSSNVKYGSGYTTGPQRIRTGSEVAHASASAVHHVIMGLRTTALRCFPDFYLD